MNDYLVSCRRQGTRIEQVFVQTAKRHNIRVVREANTYEDIYEHWDYLIEIDSKQYRVDVKDQRRRQRYDTMLKNMLVIEWKNVQGWSGWIYGCADIIAYRIGMFFHLVPREELLEYALNVVDFGRVVDSFADSLNCIYSRVGRMDLVSLIDVSCIPFEYNVLKIGE